MASPVTGLGLGIDFNPPVSASKEQQQSHVHREIQEAAATPDQHDASAHSRHQLHGQAALGKRGVLPPSVLHSGNGTGARRTASANDVDDPRRYRATTSDEASTLDAAPANFPMAAAAAAARRKVRIVSAANTYHERVQHEDYGSSAENSPALSSHDQYNAQDDILGDYANSPREQVEDGAYEQDDETYYDQHQDSIVYPTLAEPSPAPTMQTTLSTRSTGAVSSGSSTRYNDALDMAHPQASIGNPSIMDKVHEFEAKLRNLRITDAYAYPPQAGGPMYEQAQADYGMYPRPSIGSHSRSHTVDDQMLPLRSAATTHGNMPRSDSSGSISNARGGLRRATAMSRPKSMVELNQLYNGNAQADAQQQQLSNDQNYQQIVSQEQQQYGNPQVAAQQMIQHTHMPQPQAASAVHMDRTLSVQTASSGRYSEASPASFFTEEGYASSAASTVPDSAESKPVAIFMAKQHSQPSSVLAASPAATLVAVPMTGRTQSQPRLYKTQSAVSMRSVQSMRGLEEAETGGAAVVLDSLGKGFSQGVRLDPSNAGQLRSPNIVFGSEELRHGSLLMAQPSQEQLHSGTKAPSTASGRSRAASIATTKSTSSSGQTSSSLMTALPSTQGLPSLTAAAQTLQRHSTLLSAGGNPMKRAKELDRLLDPKPTQVHSQYGSTTQPYNSTDMPSRAVFGSSSGENSSGTSFHPTGAVLPLNTQLRRKPSNVVLEQASKSKARVEMDLTLAGAMVVEGGRLTGRMQVRVRKEKHGEGEVWLGSLKARIVGFEELAGEDARHVFYHHSVSLDNGTDRPDKANTGKLPCYGSEPDAEGFCKGKIGNHSFPFAMQLPTGKGAKGSWKGKAGVVKYIVIGSIKLKSHVGTDRSIAHFYRHIDVFPYLNPSIMLAPTIKPLQAETSKALFMGGTGKVHLSASLHRSTWVAGQRCYVNVTVNNEASKKVKTLNLSLFRTTTVFRPKPHLTAGNGFDDNDPVYADVDQDACSTQTTRKKVAETSLEMGKKSAKGTVTAKGMWMGVESNEKADFCHFLELPSDALTIERGRYLEISYFLKVSVSASLASDVSVDIPCHIINFVSIDPPPGHPGPATAAPARVESIARAWSTEALREATHAPSADQQSQPVPPMPRMASMDSLNMHDLNKIYSMKRHMSQDSFRTASESSAGVSSGMARSFTVPDSLQSIQEDDQDSPAIRSVKGGLPSIAEAFKRRQLRHQMSLDCIGSAIASATARRAGHQRMDSGLSTASAPHEDEEDGLPYLQQSYPPLQDGIQLDDLDDIPEEDEILPLPQIALQHLGLHPAGPSNDTPYSYSEHIQLHDNDYAEYEDESEDEVDLVLQTKHFESDDEDGETRPVSQPSIRAPLSPTSGYARSGNSVSTARSAVRQPPRSPSVSSGRRTPVSSVFASSRGSTDMPDGLTASQGQDGGNVSFGLATPASPVKKGYVPVSPSANRQPSRLTAQGGAAPSSTARSPRMTPASPRVKAAPPASARRAASTAGQQAAPSSSRPQQIERVPAVKPASTAIRTQAQPMKSAMRKVASTPALRTRAV